uniref:Uncharacterized protein n=1 Tax=Setaria digitata TaxID=48799 RepID=A0A915Q7S5_9BILA
MNFKYNLLNDIVAGKTSSQVQHPQETVNIQTAADAKIKEIRKDGILKNERDNNLRLKILPNSSRIVDAFTDIGFCLHKNNIAMHEDLSAADSDIGSRPVSLENTNETSSECTDEPGISYTSIRYHAKNWCTRSGCDGILMLLNTKNLCGAASGSHVSRGLIQASSRSLMYRSPRHDLSITRHIVRVRSAHKKRAKSAAAVIRVGRPETELECYQNKSAFYYNHDQFY